jgi:hypothetical protein
VADLGLRSPSDPGSMPSRTMPSFACCAMQGSYCLLMIYYKSRVTRQLRENPNDNPLRNPGQLAEELRSGLNRILGAVKNYASAFEALDGMRGKCRLIIAFRPSDK